MKEDFRTAEGNCFRSFYVTFNVPASTQQFINAKQPVA
jgi:hypothetical protein